MEWHRGNWTSYRNDKGAFVEHVEGTGCFVYDTDVRGRIKAISHEPLELAPAVAGPFPEMRQAEEWSEANQPAR